MIPAHITRLMTFAQHGQPKDYGGSDMMRADLETLILAACAVAPSVVSAAPAEPSDEKPIDMLLFCPMCCSQHIDAPETHRVMVNGVHVDAMTTWDNPPHKSHLCHVCGCIWRPADVPTNGVAELKTQGKADTWPAAHNEEVTASRAALPSPSGGGGGEPSDETTAHQPEQEN